MDDLAVMQVKRKAVVIDLTGSDDSGSRATKVQKRTHASTSRVLKVNRRTHAAGSKVTIRGPEIVGDHKFDPFCVFANKVKLDDSQVKFLNDKVEKGEPTRPFYVCTMLDSTVKEKSKMYFSKAYSKDNLKEYLPNYVCVFLGAKNLKAGNNIAEVKMKMSKGNAKRAIITSEWKEVVKAAKMKKGGVYMFWFRRAKPALKGDKRLNLIVEKVE